VTNGLNASVSDDWNSKTASIFGYFIDGCSLFKFKYSHKYLMATKEMLWINYLRAANSHHFLRDAN
jgi:hypothetical protein